MPQICEKPYHPQKWPSNSAQFPDLTSVRNETDHYGIQNEALEILPASLWLQANSNGCLT